MRISQLSTISVIFLLITILGGLFHEQAEAFRTTNNETNIDVDGIDIAPTNTPRPQPGSRRPQPLDLSLTPPPREKTPLRETEAKAEAKVFFSFSLAQSSIDFGAIDPTNPVIRTHQIKIDPGNARGASLFAYENHPLMTEDTKSFIPDTSCDQGTCSHKSASVWDNTLTYGFGYRCENDKNSEPLCAQDFSNQQSYRQFADVSKKELGSEMLGTFPSKKAVSGKITYKLNVPGTQQKGSYTNAVVFIAAPTY